VVILKGHEPNAAFLHLDASLTGPNRASVLPSPPGCFATAFCHSARRQKSAGWPSPILSVIWARSEASAPLGPGGSP